VQEPAAVAEVRVVRAKLVAVISERQSLGQVRRQRLERREMALPLGVVEGAQSDALGPPLVAEAADAAAETSPARRRRRSRRRARGSRARAGSRRRAALRPGRPASRARSIRGTNRCGRPASWRDRTRPISASATAGRAAFRS
jgi:hypothetical protein